MQKENKTLKSQLSQLMEFAKSQLGKFKEWQEERQQERNQKLARKKEQELER